MRLSGEQDSVDGGSRSHRGQAKGQPWGRRLEKRVVLEQHSEEHQALVSSTCSPSLAPGPKPKSQREEPCIQRVHRTKPCIIKVCVSNHTHTPNVHCGLVPGRTQVRGRCASTLAGAKDPHLGAGRENVITLECKRCSFFTPSLTQGLLAIIRKDLGWEVEIKSKFTCGLFLGPYHSA